MKILACNDDGVRAPGLAALVTALQEIAEVTVVAPERNRSGASNSLTLEYPLRTKTLDNGFIGVEGTPTDCVHLALTGLLPKQLDMVVAGINAGANLGDDVLYSGTVAAAIEGRSLGFPAMAVSLVAEEAGEELQYYSTAAQIAQRLVQQLRTDPLPAQTILNVNVPNLPLSAIKGIEVTRLGARHRAEKLLQYQDPRGHTVYWIGPPGAAEDAGPGTDFAAVKRGYVAITPLQIDLTHYKVFEQLAAWVGPISSSLG